MHHLQGIDEDEKHSLIFQNIYHIGDTKSAQELAAFLRMCERLRLCCGLQCTDFIPIMGLVSARSSFMQPSNCNGSPDGHVLATVSAIVLAFCEGRIGLAISGVFGAGNTRSAAVLLAGYWSLTPALS